MDLFSIPFLSTAIAIVISWGLFAILCSLVQEGIAQGLAERGRFMKKYLIQQLQDLSNGVNWASMFYLHGTIDLLSRSVDKPTSDISPELFAKTIVDVVGSAHVVQMQLGSSKEGEVKKFLDEQNNYTNSALYNFKAATEVLKPSDVMNFFSHALKDAEMRAVTEGALKDEAAVYNNLVSNLEQWFREFTERLQLWYQKKIRRRLFIIGVILGIVVNVDSVELFNYYQQNPESRSAVIQYYEKNAKQLTDLAGNADSARTSPGKTASLIQTAKNFLDSADKLKTAASIPVGFENSILKKRLKSLPNSTSHDPVYLWVMKILGILLSGFAASFGAPFWFDLLRKAYSKSN